MDLPSDALYVVGFAGLYVEWLWAILLAFRRSPVYGLASLLVPMLILYALVTNPRAMWQPALLLLLSLSAVVGAAQLAKP